MIGEDLVECSAWTHMSQAQRLPEASRPVRGRTHFPGRPCGPERHQQHVRQVATTLHRHLVTVRDTCLWLERGRRHANRLCATGAGSF